MKITIEISPQETKEMLNLPDMSGVSRIIQEEIEKSIKDSMGIPSKLLKNPYNQWFQPFPSWDWEDYATAKQEK